MVTIKEIAKEANVSPSTVSRVITGNKRISKETAERVKEAIRKLGYIPNANAKSMVTKKSNTIGIFIPREPKYVLSNTFFDQIIGTICEIANKNDYDILFAISTPEKEVQLLQRLVLSKKVDGFILLSSRINDKAIEYLRDIEFPMVVVGRPEKYEDLINWVDNDNKKAGYDAAKYLIDKGHKEIAFIAGPEDLVVTQDRLYGFKKACEESFIASNNIIIKYSNFYRKSSYQIAFEILKSNKRPTAIVCMDDIIGFEVTKASKDLNLAIGEDISIITFNNSIITELSNPSITTIDINIDYIGTSVAELLLMELKDPKKTYKRLIVQHTLIERSSCATL
ncbi:LacI family DNA-binding transcriptional regulator [Caldicellulosiruptoraceae bacterium PP1]